MVCWVCWCWTLIALQLSLVVRSARLLELIFVEQFVNSVVLTSKKEIFEDVRIQAPSRTGSAA